MSAVGIDLVLAFADDEHLIGQQHTEWIGVAPFLEEDLAFSSIGQDELGHAVMLYEWVLNRQGRDTSDAEVDALAYRPADEYRSCALTEFSTADWAEALVRHWIYDQFESQRWAQFASSTDAELRVIAQAAERDERFHRRHADALLDRLLGVPDARSQVMGALANLLPLVPSLLNPTPDTASAIDAGLVSGSLSGLTEDLATAIAARFGIDEPALTPTPPDRAVRSPAFSALMGRMREVIDLDVHAAW